jgi:predicted glycoside hydrolase/deacetylase ChbG (UPF0249 family)
MRDKPTTPNTSLKLIVTADDFGIGLETSRGIVQAHLNGPVTCTSLMTVTADHAKRSIPLLANAPNLEVGLHVVLSGSDRPLAATANSGLLSREGTFLPLPKLILRAFLGQLDQQACFDEITAQAEAYHKLMGRAPAYVDGHHHSHQLPTIRLAIAEAMKRGILPHCTRITTETDEIRMSVKTAGTRRRVARFLGGRARSFFAARNARSNDTFFGMLDDERLNDPFPWEVYFKHLPAGGAVEWVVHPGFDDETLVGRDGYVRQRTREMKTLTDPANQHYWRRAGVILSVKSTL